MTATNIIPYKNHFYKKISIEEVTCYLNENPSQQQKVLCQKGQENPTLPKNKLWDKKKNILNIVHSRQQLNGVHRFLIRFSLVQFFSCKKENENYLLVWTYSSHSSQLY